MKKLAEVDRWINAHLDNYFPLLRQVTDDNPAWLEPTFVTDKLRDHALLGRFDNEEEGDEVYCLIAERVGELALWQLVADRGVHGAAPEKSARNRFASS